MGQLIVEDTIHTWPVLAAGFVIAAVCSLVIIAVMRWLAGPIVWLSIVGVIVLLGAGEFMNYSLKIFKCQFIVEFMYRYCFHEALLNFS